MQFRHATIVPAVKPRYRCAIGRVCRDLSYDPELRSYDPMAWPAWWFRYRGPCVSRVEASLARRALRDARAGAPVAALGAGLHPKIAQERPGHSTIAITMDIYSHVTEQPHGDAAVKLDAAYKAFRPQFGPHFGRLRF